MVPTVATTANVIFFGQDSTAHKGTTEWDYFRWTNEGAFVPEPSVMALAAMARVALRAWRRRS